jgi:hypothetical protein
LQLFEEDQVSRWMMFPKGYYVYEIAVNGVVRYVGKGSNGRVFSHFREGRSEFAKKLRHAVRRGDEVKYRIVQQGLTNKEAFTLETKRMCSYQADTLWVIPRDMTSMLVARWSAEDAGRRQSLAMRKKWSNSDYRESVSAAQKARWQGRTRWNNKLTKKQVVAIHSLRGTVSQKEIANRFGVAQSTICDLLKRRTWDWVQ